MGVRIRNTQAIKIFKILFLSLFLITNNYNYLYAKELNKMSNISRNNTIYALRIKPNQDLRVEIENFVKINNIKSGFIITTVGSLKKASLRLSDDKHTTVIEDKFEIVSLVGTVSINGCHLHISISDKTGKTIGAHLQHGSEVYTTAEIIIGEAQDLEFTRENDNITGYKELSINKRN